MLKIQMSVPLLARLLLTGALLMTAACSGDSGGGTTNPKPVAPAITTQPASQTVTAGQPATFSVVATGTSPLAYQWQKASADISGASSDSYTTPAMTSADNGAKFDVVVSNAAGSIVSGSATITVSADVVAPTIKTQPASQTVTAGQTATFSVVAGGTAPFTYQWQKGTANISGATSAAYTTPATASADNGTKFDVVVSNSAGKITSNSATLTVTTSGPPPSTVTVLTYHNDAGRTGQNLNEKILTAANVNSTGFGKMGFLAVTGLVDAEPLYVPHLTINGASHNVVFVVTEHDMAYAFDADTFAQLWSVSLVGAGEQPSDNRGCGQVTPEIGITSTPVIAPTAGTHGTMWLVAMSKDSSGNYYQRLHALDLTTGADLETAAVAQASVPGTGSSSSGGTVTFVPAQYKERAALLLLNGVVYTSWASHCDDPGYTGWVMAYNGSTLQQTAVLNLTANGTTQGGKEGAIWMSGDGPAADASGNIYLLVGNGTFDTTLNSGGFPSQGDYGNAMVKIATAGGQLSVADYFTMHDSLSESSGDVDLGSGGELLLPDMTDSAGATRQLIVGAGKDSIIYLADRTSMGKFNPTADQIYQEVTSNGISGGVWAMPAYFNGTLYYGSVSDNLKAFSFSNATIRTPAASHSATSFGYPGTTPSISANGASNGIVWAVEAASGGGALHAYDATNLATELYNSNQAAGGRDNFSDNKFVTPMIANGKVYVGTPTGVAVFGLLP